MNATTMHAPAQESASSVAPKIAFSAYMPDGPGFHGDVQIEIDGKQAALLLMPPSDAGDPPRKLTATLDAAFAQGATISSVSPVTPQQAQQIWQVMDEGGRDYLQSADNIDPRRCNWLEMSNGQAGAVLLGGEATIVSLYSMSTDGVWAEETVEFSDPVLPRFRP